MQQHIHKILTRKQRKYRIAAIAQIHINTLMTKSNMYFSIHPMALQPKSGLGLLYLLPPQCSIISGQLPVATAQKAGSILLHLTFGHVPPTEAFSV
jgi:hypothetical protein